MVNDLLANIQNGLKPLFNDTKERDTLARKMLESINHGNFTMDFRENSQFYDFAGKIKKLSVALKIDPNNLTEMVKNQHGILTHNTDKLIENFHDTIDNFNGRYGSGSLPDVVFRKMVTESPTLLTMGKTNKGENTLVKHFSDVLQMIQPTTAKQYLAALTKRPVVWALNPETIDKNISEVVEAFKDYGLTKEVYVKAALEQPQLFYQKSSTIIENVAGVINQFKDKGINPKKYLDACVKQPSLFYRDKETMIGHIDLMIAGYMRGNVKYFEGKQEVKDPKRAGPKPVLDFVCSRPDLICMAHDNLLLTEMVGVHTGSVTKSFYRESKDTRFTTLMGALGFNPEKPIPQPDEAMYTTNQDMAMKATFLRAMAHNLGLEKFLGESRTK